MSCSTARLRMTCYASFFTGADTLPTYPLLHMVNMSPLPPTYPLMHMVNMSHSDTQIKQPWRNSYDELKNVLQRGRTQLKLSS